MQPDIQAINVGAFLPIIVEHKNADLIGDMIFPVITCGPNAKIMSLLRGNLFKNHVEPVEDGSPAHRNGYVITTIDVDPKQYGFSQEITDAQQRNMMYQGTPIINMRTKALEIADNQVKINREILVAAATIGSVPTWSGETGGTDVAGTWAAGAGNTFISDVETWSEYIRARTGRPPNALMISANTYSELKQESTVIDKIKYVKPANITAADIASMFEYINTIYIGSPILNTADQTVAGTEFTTSNIWEQNAGHGSAFLFTQDTPSMFGYAGSGLQARQAYENGQPIKLVAYREDKLRQEVYEVFEMIDIVQTSAATAVAFTDTILT